MSCSICGKDVSYPGSTQHFKIHRKEFADVTGYSENCHRQIIIAYMNKQKARKWAVEIVEQLKKANKIPKDGVSLEDFDGEK